MAYGNLLTDVVQSSTTNTPPVFKDGNGTEIGTLCRAWVNFNGVSGSVAIRGGFNVSSVTRLGSGYYQINLTNAMVDANFAVFATAKSVANSGNAYYVGFGEVAGQPRSSSVVYVSFGTSPLTEPDYVNVGVFR